MKIKLNKSNKYNITLGSDPELFFENKIECVSAEGIVPGTKQEPHFISKDGHAIQLDNVAAEFNIPPVETKEDWIKELKVPIEHLNQLAKDRNLKISDKASYLFNQKYLKTENARQFGCSPDYDVYIQDINEKPVAEDNRLRSCGGHVSIGYPDQNIENTEKIVKMFDLFVVLPSLLIDKDERRRELYGKAGCFRFTPFGVECRSLSNFWIFSDELMGWVFDQTMIAINIVLDGDSDYFINKYSEETRRIINENDKDSALNIIKELEINLI